MPLQQIDRPAAGGFSFSLGFTRGRPPPPTDLAPSSSARLKLESTLSTSGRSRRTTSGRLWLSISAFRRRDLRTCRGRPGRRGPSRSRRPRVSVARNLVKKFAEIWPPEGNSARAWAWPGAMCPTRWPGTPPTAPRRASVRRTPRPSMLAVPKSLTRVSQSTVSRRTFDGLTTSQRVHDGEVVPGAQVHQPVPPPKRARRRGRHCP